MKKLVAVSVALLLGISLSIPASASSFPTESYTEVNIFKNFAGDDTIYSKYDIELCNAYIKFSEQLAVMGISANTCLEDFINGYENALDISLQSYISVLIQDEISAANERNTIISANKNLKSNNSEVIPYSVGSQWYDDIGDATPVLPQAPSYDKYNLIDKVDKGDVFQETSGGVAALTGHIAIVQGLYWDKTFNVFYLRTIEAGVGGVVYGVLDDERYDFRQTKIYSVSCTIDAKYGAIDFCIDQLGKDYNWLGITGVGSCSTSRNASIWYCSELIWAAYYSQNVNIYGNGIPVNTYLPIMFAASKKLSRITIT